MFFCPSSTHPNLLLIIEIFMPDFSFQTPFSGLLVLLIYEVVGRMSSFSGLNSQGKGDKKKYSQYNINEHYKGKALDVQKSTGNLLKT